MEGINWKAAKVELSPNCPRCGSSNTKFCYYNNYSLTQPRYFCKGCRRYWTKGGSLRNVPVGGGCRKNHRRSKSCRHDRLASKDLAAGHHHQYPTGSTALLAVSSSTTGSSSSNIDLALVYANFLHQKTEPKSTSLSEMPELPSELHPSFQLSTNGKQPDSSSYDHIQLPPKTHLSEGNNHGHVYLGGSFHHDHDDAANVHGLPPLPDQEMLWPISQVMLQNHTFHQTQFWPVLLQPEASQDPNIAAPSAGKWSPFDLPSYM